MFLANKMDYRVNFHVFVLIFTGKKKNQRTLYQARARKILPVQRKKISVTFDGIGVSVGQNIESF